MNSKKITFKQSINILPDPVVVVDENATIVTVNDLSEQVFGYTSDEIIGQNLEILIPPRFRESHNKHFRSYFENSVLRKMGEDLQLVGLKKNGDELDTDIALAPIVLDKKKYIIATIRDITQLKTLDRILLKKNEHLSEINAELERFGYVIAHDLKSPLLNIHAISKLMVRELPQEKSQSLESYLVALDECLRSMMDLIQGVSEYSKAGINETTDEEINLTQVLNEVRTLIYLPAHIQLNYSDNLPKIKGNKTKVLQVFLNLINNAIHYNDKPEGKILVKCDEKSCNYIISVSDNGPGVPAALREKIFKLFQKGSIQKIDSQGIGLAVVQKIIEGRGGSIEGTESKLGGAKFIFNWPKCK